MKSSIVDVLKKEMTLFTFPVIVNNLPSIDGLLCGQREIIYAMDKANMNSNGQFYKMLKAAGVVYNYYVLGDSGLTGSMKNMGNNYSLNKYLLPKGSFGNKNLRDGNGSAPRYIECKLSPYSECMLEGINKNAVQMKDNYDATEKEPVILPSKIPNILCNLRTSIAVSEANTMPSHNMEDVCDSIISYIKTNNIDKSIELLKVPDLPSGGAIIYDKKTFDKIYKTGKGSFINLGKYKYIKEKNMISIYEIPYNTVIENIYDEIKNNYSKFQSEISSISNGSDKNGLNLRIYLKKGANVDVVIQKLRKYTSYESKFKCNFTILDLDGKTPMLMNLETIITKWLEHRTSCLIRETNFDIKEQSKLLNRLYGLKIINEDLDKAISIIRSSKNENIAKELLKKEFNLNDEQLNYICTIKLVNINHDWITKRITNIDEIENKIEYLNHFKNDKNSINNKIIEQLNEVKNKFKKARQTEIIYEDNIKPISKQDLIEDCNYRLAYTSTYIKKYSKVSDNQKIKDGDIIIEQDIQCNNRDTLLLFTNKANRYKIAVNDLETITPSKSYGDYIPNLLKLEEDEHILRIVPINDKSNGYMIFTYANGKTAKVSIKSYISSSTKLINCYNTNSKLLDLMYIEDDIDILSISDEGKGLIFNTKNINSKASKSTQGNNSMKTDVVVFSKIGITKDNYVIINTDKGKMKEILLDDVAETNKPNEERSWYKYLSGKSGNGGNFIINCRSNNDTIKEVRID